jgi:hypothetical protein
MYKKIQRGLAEKYLIYEEAGDSSYMKKNGNIQSSIRKQVNSELSLSM